MQASLNYDENFVSSSSTRGWSMRSSTGGGTVWIRLLLRRHGELVVVRGAVSHLRRVGLDAVGATSDARMRFGAWQACVP